ncbi:MAG: histidine phosphatase family protein [Acidimicrobiales bacterium]
MTTLLLVRHGQSTWNAQRRWQGQADPPLSDVGRAQAKAAALRVGAVDVVVSSPQQRARQTAGLIAEAIGVGPIVEHDDLRERNAGAWSGLTTEEIEERYPGWLAADRRPEGFEGAESVAGRFAAALTALASGVREMEPGASTVLVLTHGGSIKAFEEAHGIYEDRIPNLSGRLVTFHGDRFRLAERLHLLDDHDRTGGGTGRV